MIEPFRTNRRLQGLVLWLIALWIITAVDPLYPRDWLLENLLVFFYGALLIITYRWFKGRGKKCLSNLGLRDDFDEPVLQTFGALQTSLNVMHGFLRHRDAFAVTLGNFTHGRLDTSVGHAS